MRRAKVLFKDEEAGFLTQHDDGTFSFRYSDEWILASNKPGISLTLPKTNVEHKSDTLFPFFYNMLPEGSNRQLACKLNRIDNNDFFGLLMATARHDTIGAVRIIKSDI